MTVEFRLPSLGEGITDADVLRVLVAVGDSVRAEQSVVEIETDKATIEMPAPISGKITKLLKKTGDKAKVGEVIGQMEESAAPAKQAAAPAAAPVAQKSVTPSPAATSTPKSPAAVGGAAHVMPAAARELAQRGLSSSEVSATGPGGRLLKEDVLRHAPGAAPPMERIGQARGDGAAAGHGGDRHDEVVPMTPMRKRIAERLVEARSVAALLTTFNEVDLSEVMALRAEHNEAFQKKHGFKLGFMSFFVKATIDGLKQIPSLNAEVRGTDIVYKNYYDIGVAVATGKGLAVPVIRGAERMSFAELERTIADFGARGRENKLTLAELEGGTFTISNGGIFGSLMGTPIVNPPQSGILGMHAIQDRPVARDGQVVIRPMMYVALTYDHRIIDGREAATFLVRLKQCIENPARMLLEI